MSESPPLGKVVDYDAAYNPELLFAIARKPGREALGMQQPPPFTGWDIWTAYELSWLDLKGKPQVACAEIWIPAESAFIVESKSLKLYLNSLNQHRFANVDALHATIESDLAVRLGAAPEVQILLPDAWSGATSIEPEGECIDAIDVAIEHYEPAPQLLRNRSDAMVTERLHSHLLRSRCPVTGQPDWATLFIDYTGPAIDRAGLLAYIVSFRLHQDFHEHCVERIFSELQRYCAPQRLTVYARYLRRGGLDINPFRSTEAQRPPPRRGIRQ